MGSFSPEFLKLFKENTNLFYSQPFIEGISYEYGLLSKSKNTKKASYIYKDAADFKYDYLCMYRMHRIFLTDYESFGLKMNEDLHRLYLYKCFAYLPYLIIDRVYYLLNKIDVTYELAIILDKYENNKYEIFDKFMDFLEKNKSQFNVTSNDIMLMKSVFKGYFSSDLIKKNIEVIDSLLEFEKGDNAYYEAQLKYCNFYLECSGEKCDKKKVKNIFDNLINAEYYKACCDYGRFLINEKKYDESKKIFKKGSDNSQQFCMSEYTFLLLWTTNFDQFINNFKLISFLLKQMCLIFCLDQLGTNSFFYTMFYLTKHSSFKQQILNDFGKYTIEMFKTKESFLQLEKNEFVNNNFAEKYTIEIPNNVGMMYYYGISNLIKSDKEIALNYLKKSYKLAKEKEYNSYIRDNYIYIYKCRKYLFKNNKITLRKLNKTKEKLFRLYEECDLDDLDPFELYNYYKLYKIGVYVNTQNKLISILKKGKIEKRAYHFKNIVYR